MSPEAKIENSVIGSVMGGIFIHFAGPNLQQVEIFIAPPEDPQVSNGSERVCTYNYRVEHTAQLQDEVVIMPVAGRDNTRRKREDEAEAKEKEHTQGSVPVHSRIHGSSCCGIAGIEHKRVTTFGCVSTEGDESFNEGGRLFTECVACRCNVSVVTLVYNMPG